MSIIDKIAAVVAPQPDKDKRAEATAGARAAATPRDWLSLVIDHHDQAAKPLRQANSRRVPVVSGPRIGIRQGTATPWRFGRPASPYLSRPFAIPAHA